MKSLYRQPLLLLNGIFFFEIGFAQDSIPSCLLQKAKEIAESHRKNPCEGGDHLNQINCYNYLDTILYKFVFENKKPCPDFINHTFYFDSSCQVRIEVIDGGLMYRHIVLPTYINMTELKFIRYIKTNTTALNKKSKHKN